MCRLHLRLSQRFRIKAQLCRCVSTHQKVATQSLDRWLSPGGRALKHPSAALAFLTRATSIACKRRLASGHFRAR